MYLSKYEERILNGEFGEAKAIAMRVIVKVGEALGANKLIRISHAHVSGISYFNIREYGLDLLRKLMVKGASFTVYTTANPYAVINTDFIGNKFSNTIIEKQKLIVSMLKQMGAKAFTCAPYYIRKPKRGEHLAWAESNAVLYANSIVGARTNREGGPTALMSAIVGRTYYWGMHLNDYILPCMSIRAFPVKSIIEAGALGYIIGKVTPHCIPYLKNLIFPSEAHIRAFLAAFGTTSSAPAVVIEGLTPLSKSEKENIKSVKEETILERSEVLKFVNQNTLKEKPKGRGLYLLGCPHLNIGEVNELLMLIKGLCNKALVSREVLKDKELWLISLAEPANKEDEALRKCNVKVVPHVCPVVSRLDLLGVDYIVTDSFKAAHYIRSISGVEVFVTDRIDVIRRYFMR